MKSGALWCSRGRLLTAPSYNHRLLFAHYGPYLQHCLAWSLLHLCSYCVRSSVLTPHISSSLAAPCGQSCLTSVCAEGQEAVRSKVLGGGQEVRPGAGSGVRCELLGPDNCRDFSTLYCFACNGKIDYMCFTEQFRLLGMPPSVTVTLENHSTHPQ